MTVWSLVDVTYVHYVQKMAEEVSQYLHGMDKWDGLVATYIEGHSGSFKVTSAVSVGGSADSYYEYLLKQWLQTGRTKDWYLPLLAAVRCERSM